MEEIKPPESRIKLSRFTEALIASLKSIRPKPRPDDLSKLTVSQTVAFLAIVYERIRNAVEFREEHHILRAAIERIIKRRLAMNPTGKNEAENLLRELLWARYFDNNSLGGNDILEIQEILDRYLMIKKTIVTGRDGEMQQYLTQFLIDLMTSEIEEKLTPEKTGRYSSFTHFIFQVLKKKIKIEGLTETQKDAYFLNAIEKAYRKSDKPYQRYHLFATFYKPVLEYDLKELNDFIPKLHEVFKKIDDMIASPYVDKLTKFTRKQLPSFLVLFTIIKNKASEIETILTNKEKLWNEVDLTCREKYQQLNTRMRNLAIRSFIYIFLTKMIFALILELPATRYFYGEINWVSIAINTIFPPVLMLIIISFFRIPGEDNTKKIYGRLVEIIDADTRFETSIAYMPKVVASKRPTLVFGFTIFYTLTFLVTLALIYQALTLLNFNVISQLIFIFFVSVVTFFSYRIRQIVNEYRLEEKEGIFTPFVDIFFMPVLSLGKFFSAEIAKLNFFIFVFDFLIEAPFKLVFEIIEEWVSFVKKRKEEII